MTPEERQMLTELYQWMQQKKQQQITAPLDEASRNTLGIISDRGAGSTSATQSIFIAATPSSITAPTNPIGSRLFEVDGVRYEIPYLSTS